VPQGDSNGDNSFRPLRGECVRVLTGPPLSRAALFFAPEKVLVLRAKEMGPACTGPDRSGCFNPLTLSRRASRPPLLDISTSNRVPAIKPRQLGFLGAYSVQKYGFGSTNVGVWPLLPRCSPVVERQDSAASVDRFSHRSLFAHGRGKGWKTSGYEQSLRRSRSLSANGTPTDSCQELQPHLRGPFFSCDVARVCRAPLCESPLLRGRRHPPRCQDIPTLAVLLHVGLQPGTVDRVRSAAEEMVHQVDYIYNGLVT
jgi:hypothetical protein